MAIALTTEAGLACRPDALPVAVLELSESPDAVRLPAAQHASEQTAIHVVDGVVYVIAGDHDWVLTAGDTASIDAGIPYRRWNAGDSDARWVEVYCAG
ncbi:MAG TPA: cupin domain-containing protein [Thermoleophilaceae bacterium]|nr:cupin domain-containing protein [Thermoleophilaceae bacterium]